MKVTDKHVLFFSYRDMFSNHYYAPFTMNNEGPVFKTVEHCMMYGKAITFNDSEAAAAILAAKNPNDAKKIGRGVKNYDNEVWERLRSGIVIDALVNKMFQHKKIREKALEYRKQGKLFVEASPYDKLWGIGLGEDHKDADNPDLWVGKNLLGQCWEEAIDRLEMQEAQQRLNPNEA